MPRATFFVTAIAILSGYAGSLAWALDEVAKGKPAPDIYLHAAQATGHPADACIVIEDSRHGIAGARTAGMRTVGFAGGGHATKGLCRELLDAGASIVISHMRDLPCAIRSLCDLKERRT